MHNAVIACLLGCLGPLLATEFDQRDAVQWHWEEWSVDNPTWSGNAFDVLASVTFEHPASGETRTTEMFYDGGTTWRFRFTGTRSGAWQFTTSSSDSDLDGHSGTVQVAAPGADARGFLRSSGNVFVEDLPGGTQGYLVNVWMNGKLQPEFLGDWDADPAVAADQGASLLADARAHGMEMPWALLGHHLLQRGADGWNEHDSEEPDLTVFRMLESVITRIHQEGGRFHMWAWGDENRKWTPRGLRGGINGVVDRRLQRYIAARLGPIPGWSLGYGFDLHEWVSGSAIDAWADYMHDRMGWDHLLIARSYPFASAAGNVASYSTDDVEKDPAYSAEPDPSYATIVGHLGQNTDRPHLYNERHSLGRWSMDAEDHRALMWRAAMAGGLGGWYGFFSSTSGGYGNQDQLQTHYAFWHQHQRFLQDYQRDNAITSHGWGLRTADASRAVVYASGRSSLTLSGLPSGLPIVGVDALAAYAEVDLGSTAAGDTVLDLPGNSDWAIAIGTFASSGGGTPPSIAAVSADPATVAGTTTTLGVVANEPDGDDLTYLWQATSRPTGANPSIGSGATPTVTFDLAGEYLFTVTVSDADGSDSESVPVTVVQTGLSLDIVDP